MESGEYKSGVIVTPASESVKKKRHCVSRFTVAIPASAQGHQELKRKGATAG